MAEAQQEVADSLRKVVAWFEGQFGEADLGLGPPASADEISAAEEAINARLPGPVRAAYEVSNGQRIRPTHYVFPDAHRWLPLEDLVRIWKIQVGLFERDDDEVFGKEWWHPGLIPLTENGCGDGAYVDLDGRNNGVVGEIIDFIHDDWPSQRTERTHPKLWSTDSDGLGSMLRRYAADLNAGRYVVDEYSMLQDRELG